MSDSDKSGVTYTDISSPFEELSDIGSPRADDHEHLMLPEMLEDPYVEVALQAPPSSDYIPGPEEPEQAPPLPDYIPGPEHADNEIVAEDQPYAEDASPIAQSPKYVPESDFEAHPEEMMMRTLRRILLIISPMEEMTAMTKRKPSETDESAATPPPYPAYRTTARITIPAPVPMPAWTDSEVVRLLAISSPPSSPLSPWSLPSPQIPFPLLPPILLPPLPLPSASRREDRPEVTLPPRKRLDIALGLRYEVGESSSAAAARLAGGFRADYGFVATVDREIMRDPEREAGYEITDSWDEIVETLQGAPVGTDTELGGYLNMLFRDRHAHAYTRQLMKTEARMSREAWVRATDASDHVHGEVMSLRTTVLGQMSEIRELQATDHRRQTVISELLRIDHRRSTEISELRTALQGQVTALQGQVTASQAQVTTLQGQQGLARDHTQSELPEEAGGSAYIRSFMASHFILY
nr:hypothetical protein [Tanacetum cinerariifolium]